MTLATKPVQKPWVTFGFNLLVFLLTVAVGFFLAEMLLRVKNSSQQNYNIEMWRYARLLKIPSSDARLGHEHRRKASAKLQGVEIRLNRYGMRGPDVAIDAGKKRILVLGSSNTLGWGVEEQDTMTALLQKGLGDSAVMLNAGIGNYNAERYVTLYEKSFQDLKPDVVIVHYFVNDAEILPYGGGNFLLRHSQLAVMLYHMIQNFKNARSNISTLTQYYKKIYTPGNEGLRRMERAMDRLDHLSQTQGFKVILAMVPDIHVLENYPFGFVHEHMQKLAARHGWTYVDFLDALKQFPARELWAMPGDPHLNRKAHKVMADVLLPYLKP